jgi:peptidoglycan/xylan/chitin deacetylase (PgdA/CDA1 family)
MKHLFRQSLLQGVYRSGAHRFIANSFGVLGAILMIHRVVRRKADSLALYLTATESHIEETILTLRKLGISFVSMSDLSAILRGEKMSSGRVVALTFDDGYIDNLTFGLPILEKYGVPATVYVASGAPDRTMDVWFLRLERLLRDRERLSLHDMGSDETLELGTIRQKNAAYARLTDVAHQDIASFKTFLDTLLPVSQLSDAALADEHFLDWNGLRRLSEHPLITVGAHTDSHAVLKTMSDEGAFGEMIRGRDRLTQELERSIDHFAYPYGGAAECGPREFELARRAGFETAVTTRYGNIYRQHRHHLHCLPRMTLGGPVERLADTVLDVSGTRTVLSRQVLSRVVTV